MKDLIETAKGFSTVEKEKKVQGDHKTLWEAAKNFELLDEKISPRNKIAMINLLNNIIKNVESMQDVFDGNDTKTNVQIVLKDQGGIEKLEDLLVREIDSR